MQQELKVAPLDLSGCGLGAFHFVRAFIPNLNLPGAVIAFRNFSLELRVIDRVILHVNCQPLFAALLRRTFWDGPRSQRAIHFEPKVVVQAASGMALHHKNRHRPTS